MPLKSNTYEYISTGERPLFRRLCDHFEEIRPSKGHSITELCRNIIKSPDHVSARYLLRSPNTADISTYLSNITGKTSWPLEEGKAARPANDHCAIVVEGNGEAQPIPESLNYQAEERLGCRTLGPAEPDLTPLK